MADLPSKNKARASGETRGTITKTKRAVGGDFSVPPSKSRQHDVGSGTMTRASHGELGLSESEADWIVEEPPKKRAR